MAKDGNLFVSHKGPKTAKSSWLTSASVGVQELRGYEREEQQVERGREGEKRLYEL